MNYDIIRQVKRRVFTVWYGDDEMSQTRKNCFEQLKNTIGKDIELILITPNNINEWLVEPLHPGFEYLSLVHKADYLRTYLLHFHGGGYTDIKKLRKSWSGAFDVIQNDENIWIVGYKEISPGYSCVPFIQYDSEIHEYPDIDKRIHKSPGFDYLVGNCQYIIRPNTDFTKEWYNNMIRLMNKKYEELKKNPPDPSLCNAPIARCSKDSQKSYPIHWNELLARIFHPLNYKYGKHVSRCLPHIIIGPHV